MLNRVEPESLQWQPSGELTRFSTAKLFRSQRISIEYKLKLHKETEHS